MNDDLQGISNVELEIRIEQLLKASADAQFSVIDEANAYQEIITATSITQANLAKRLGCSQATIANKLRLLKLSDVAKTALQNNQITERHGRTILKLEKRKQVAVVNKILKHKLNVKQTEELVQELVQTQLDLPTQQAMLRDFLKQGMQRLAKQGVFVEQLEFDDHVILKIIDKNQTERNA
ncbi:ParB/RepB/Spo0J family partition protein [Periweissella ghanensis]|uniref:Nucleoid occlusion protein n=1 Tax=Periweissella ghanensis TaxID=467997 RepID=A0ABM8ZD84_9LACO|nr:ParB/RepB/Spo0J family partition protein [Periweissella ghanensis]MCM0600150.1 hypothetical protein [Periweissella ghanensis]CAH0419208.1 Nucleoid occlusion protein [Periweissella ghanensis]